MSLNMDAFSDGQVRSKLWLCEVLEANRHELPENPVIWVFGCWYGILPFLLFARGKLEPRLIRGFDIDADAVEAANRVNNRWEIESWKFRAFQADVNELDYLDGKFGPAPDLVINTSTEHFRSEQWWERLTAGTAFAVQGTDMILEDHVNRRESLKEFEERFGQSGRTWFSGELRFNYPDKTFSRFMVQGRK